MNKPNYLLYEEIHLSNREIENVRSIQYLCVSILSDQSDNNEVENQYRKLCSRANVIARKFTKCSQQVKNELFSSILHEYFWY